MRQRTFDPGRVRSATHLRESALSIGLRPDFSLFSRVMREGLSTGRGARRPESGLSERIFSRPHDCADLVNSFYASTLQEILSFFQPQLSTSIPVALADMGQRSNVHHFGRCPRRYRATESR